MATDSSGSSERLFLPTAVEQTAELQRALRQAQAATRAKDEFLANLSHEVRTPLNAIMGLTQLLLQTEPSEEQENYLRLLDTSATALLALLNDILDFSKIEAGKLVFEHVRFDLRQWIEDAVAPHAMQARAKGLQFTLQLDESLPATVMGDPGRLRQVLSNLMSNAVKFTEHGEVRVRARLAPDDETLEDGHLCLLFDVRDTGIGVPASKRKSIFNAFTQADPSTTRRYGGTGLGLAICARLVRMMNGKIRVTSAPGQGSLFRFSVVLGQAFDSPSVFSMPVPLDASPMHGLHVLLAEDHPINAMLMSKLLEKMRCSFELASDGEQAVDLWKTGRFDLVLMDVQMPQLSGFDATRQIRQLERSVGAHMPIVALTAHAMAGDRERCLEAGMDAYASKPVSAETLTQAMRDALAHGAKTVRPLAGESLFDPAGWATGGVSTLEGESVAADPEATPSSAVRAGMASLDASVAKLSAAIERQDEALSRHYALELERQLALAKAQRAAQLARSMVVAIEAGKWSLLRRALPVFMTEIEAMRSEPAPKA